MDERLPAVEKAVEEAELLVAKIERVLGVESYLSRVDRGIFRKEDVFIQSDKKAFNEGR